jgi:hypothetical protein
MIFDLHFGIDYSGKGVKPLFAVNVKIKRRRRRS